MKKVHDFVRDEKPDWGIMNRRMLLGYDGAIAFNRSIDVDSLCGKDEEGEAYCMFMHLALSVNERNEICYYLPDFDLQVPATDMDGIYMAVRADNRKRRKRFDKLLSKVEDIFERVNVMKNGVEVPRFLLNREIAFLYKKRYIVSKAAMDWFNSLDPIDFDKLD